MQPGTLFYIVGPSGAGKDTLLDGAMRILQPTGRYARARRTITRPAGAGEDHEPATQNDFDEIARRGGFLHAWQAHGLSYGLPVSILDELNAGRNVLANGSRNHIPELKGIVDRFVVVEVRADPRLLRARLVERGRESAEEIDARILREAEQLPEHLDIVRVDNSGLVEDAVSLLVAGMEERAARLAVRPLPLSFKAGNMLFLAPGNQAVDAAGFAAMRKVEIVGPTGILRATVALLDAPDLLARDEIGLSVEAADALVAPVGTLVSVRRTPTPDSRRLVRTKMAGGRLNADEYGLLFADIVAGRYSEGEAAAFLVKVIQSLDDEEAICVARARTKLGARVDWQRPIVVDKHSLGGVPGSRITPIVVAIVAAHGLTIPKTSSRAITSAAGTADVMEALCRVDLTPHEFQRVVRETNGCVAWNGRLNHSALDDIVNAITRPLGLDSNHWSVASILSKKWLAGATHVVVDMPYGPRAKLTTLDDAQALGRLFEIVGEGLALEVRPIATPGSAAIGRGIGPALELRDALAVLDNADDAPADLREKALRFATEILAFDPAIGTIERGRERALELLTNGMAGERLRAIAKAQGPSPVMTGASLRHTVRSRTTGMVTGIDGRVVSGLARRAGAPCDAGAGIDLAVAIGDRVSTGDVLYTIQACDPSLFRSTAAEAERVQAVVVEASQNAAVA
jgi:thymidine phosphorylase